MALDSRPSEAAHESENCRHVLRRDDAMQQEALVKKPLEALDEAEVLPHHATEAMRTGRRELRSAPARRSRTRRRRRRCRSERVLAPEAVPPGALVRFVGMVQDVPRGLSSARVLVPRARAMRRRRVPTCSSATSFTRRRAARRRARTGGWCRTPTRASRARRADAGRVRLVVGASRRVNSTRARGGDDCGGASAHRARATRPRPASRTRPKWRSNTRFIWHAKARRRRGGGGGAKAGKSRRRALNGGMGRRRPPSDGRTDPPGNGARTSRAATLRRARRCRRRDRRQGDASRGARA